MRNINVCLRILHGGINLSVRTFVGSPTVIPTTRHEMHNPSSFNILFRLVSLWPTFANDRELYSFYFVRQQIKVQK